MNFDLKKLKRKIKLFLSHNLVITNIGSTNNKKQIKAALAHNTEQFFSNSINVYNHANTIHSTLLLTGLIRFGACIDCYHHVNKKSPNNKYQLIIGLGNCWRNLVRLNPNAIKVLWLVEPSPEILNKNEQKKISKINKKQLYLWNFKPRYKTYYIEDDLKKADFIFYFGEKHEKDLIKYKPKEKLICIRPCGMDIKEEIFPNKDAKDILWFGGGEYFRKGLDYLLESKFNFKNTRINICGVRDKKIESKLKQENFYFHGRINTDSQYFRNLINKCRFSILLSYGEGLPISIVTTMKAGLIPIISENCGSDFGGYALIIKEEQLNPINLCKVLEEVLNKDIKELDQWSKKCKEFSLKNFNQKNYLDDIKNGLSNLRIENKNLKMN